MDNRPQEALGLNHVQNIVQVAWRSGWQTIAPENDDAIDGILFFRKGGHDTGQVIYVQVKAGPSYYKEWQGSPNVLGVALGQKHIEAHRSRWNKLPGPVILVYVLARPKKKLRAWWTDLRSEDSYSASNRQVVLLQRSNTFGVHSKGHLIALTRPTTLDLPILVAERRHINLCPLGHDFKRAARSYYADWGRTGPAERTHPRLGTIEVSRVGWRHITRAGHRPERIIHSLHLLGIAREMATTDGAIIPIGRAKSHTNADGSREIVDYLAQRANVTFPHRGPAVVQMVLRRKRSFDTMGRVSSRLWFYSIYELSRSKPAWA